MRISIAYSLIKSLTLSSREFHSLEDSNMTLGCCHRLLFHIDCAQRLSHKLLSGDRRVPALLALDDGILIGLHVKRINHSVIS